MFSHHYLRVLPPLLSLRVSCLSARALHASTQTLIKIQTNDTITKAKTKAAKAAAKSAAALSAIPPTPSPVTPSPAPFALRSRPSSRAPQQQEEEEDDEDQFEDIDEFDDEESSLIPSSSSAPSPPPPPPNSPLGLLSSLLRRRRVLHEAPRVDTGTVENPAETFQSLSIDPVLISALQSHYGISTPTSIQSSASRAIFRRQPCLVHAPTGTGKTLAFVLPVLSQLLNSPRETVLAEQAPILFRRPVPRQGIRAVFVVPNAALASQIYRVIKTLTENTKLTVQLVASGSDECASEAVQRRSLLSACPDIVVCTPKRALSIFFPHLAKARITEEQMRAMKRRRHGLDDPDASAVTGDPSDLSTRSVAKAYKAWIAESRLRGEDVSMNMEEYFRWQSMRPAGDLNEHSELLLSAEFLVLDEVDELLPVQKFHSLKQFWRSYEPVKKFMEEFRKVNALAQLVGCSATVSAKSRAVIDRLGWRNERPVMVRIEAGGEKEKEKIEDSKRGQKSIEDGRASTPAPSASSSSNPITLPATVSHHYALVPSRPEIASGVFPSLSPLAVQAAELERAAWNVKGRQISGDLTKAKERAKYCRRQLKVAEKAAANARERNEIEKKLEGAEKDIHELQAQLDAHKLKDPLARDDAARADSHQFHSKLRLTAAIAVSHKLRHSLLVLAEPQQIDEAYAALQGFPGLEPVILNFNNILVIQKQQIQEIEAAKAAAKQGGGGGPATATAGSKLKKKRAAMAAAISNSAPPKEPESDEAAPLSRVYLTLQSSLRGLDFPALECVFLPFPERVATSTEYIHISGRVGRLGREGFCVHLLYPDQLYSLRPFIRLLGIQFQQIPLFPLQRLLMRVFHVDPLRSPALAGQSRSVAVADEDKEALARKMLKKQGVAIEENEAAKEEKAEAAPGQAAQRAPAGDQAAPIVEPPKAPAAPTAPSEPVDPIAQRLSAASPPAADEAARRPDERARRSVAAKVLAILDEKLDVRTPSSSAAAPSMAAPVAERMGVKSMLEELAINRSQSQPQPQPQLQPQPQPVHETADLPALEYADRPEPTDTNALASPFDSAASAFPAPDASATSTAAASLSPMSPEGYWYPEYDDEDNWVEEEEPHERALRLIQEERALIDKLAEERAMKQLAIKAREEQRLAAYRLGKAGPFMDRLKARMPERFTAPPAVDGPILVDQAELLELKAAIAKDLQHARYHRPRPISALYQHNIQANRFVDAHDQLSTRAAASERIVKRSAIVERERMRKRVLYFKQVKLPKIKLIARVGHKAAEEMEEAEKRERKERMEKMAAYRRERMERHKQRGDAPAVDDAAEDEERPLRPDELEWNELPKKRLPKRHFKQIIE